MNKEDRQQIAHELGEEGFDKLWRAYGNILGTVNESSDADKLRRRVVRYLRTCLALAKHLRMERDVQSISQALDDWTEA